MSTAERQFGRIRVKIVHDDISRLRADVLVNAANNQLQMGGGVAAALRSRGGIEIDQEAIRHAPAAIGKVIKTTAGRLDARFVYHAVVIDYDVSKGTAATDVSSVMRNILLLAEEDGVASIGVPLFGAGVGGLSVEASMETILTVLEGKGPSFPRDLGVMVAVLNVDEHDRARAAFQSFLDSESRAREESAAASEFLSQYLKKRASDKDL